MAIDIENISDVTSEAGIIATLLNHPDFVYYSDALEPSHFTNEQNAKYYQAISFLAKQEIVKLDAYNITTAMNKLNITSVPSTVEINDFLDNASFVARSSVDEYRLLCDSVLDKSFRRELYRKLRSCEGLCANKDERQIQQTIYNTLDDVMLKYSNNDEIPEYKQIVDELFDEIEASNNKNKSIGWSFEFPALNKYCQILRGELVVTAAIEKVGKSLFLMQACINLLEQGVSVFYLDTELSSRQFTARALAHMTGISYQRIIHKDYSNEDREKLLAAKAHMKEWKFTHLYLPVMTDNDIYMSFKKVMHQRGVDVFILDYIKSSNEDKITDAYAVKNYAALGNRVNLIKNSICGQHNVAGLAAVQLTATGKIADSANVARFASTILILRDKTEDEIEADGDDAQTKALSVFRNRNGEQMRQGDYISLKFDPVSIRFSEPERQPVKEEPV